jgi:signal transduction histidine kinase
MEGMDLGLSPGFRLDVMAGYAEAVKRYGILVRTAATAVMLSAAGFASPAWRALQLLPLTAGLGLAWLDAYPPISEVLLGSRGLRRWLDAHTTAVRTTATINLAGLLEGFGVVIAGLLFAGPLPVSMPHAVRLAALIAVTAFGWNAFSQVASDPGYYKADPPPADSMVVMRWLLPLAAAASAFVIYTARAAPAERVPLWAAALLAGSLLLIWPYIGTLNLLLRYAQSSASAQVTRNLDTQQYIHHEYVHRAKNELRPSVRNPETDAEYDAFSTAVVVVENARRDISASASADYDDAHPAVELWKTYQRTIDDAAFRDRLQFIDRTDSRKLSHMEGLILQSIFVGFVSNALRARPEQVIVTVSEETDEKGAPVVRVVVEDDGAGGAPRAFEEGSSLARLDAICRQRGGGVHIVPRECAGTRATATFSYPYRFTSKPEKTNDPSREAMVDGQLPGPSGRRRSIIHNMRHRLALPRS